LIYNGINLSEVHLNNIGLDALDFSLDPFRYLRDFFLTQAKLLRRLNPKVIKIFNFEVIDQNNNFTRTMSLE
jgi:hypothetical protein